MKKTLIVLLLIAANFVCKAQLAYQTLELRNHTPCTIQVYIFGTNSPSTTCNNLTDNPNVIVSKCGMGAYLTPGADIIIDNNTSMIGTWYQVGVGPITPSPLSFYYTAAQANSSYTAPVVYPSCGSSACNQYSGLIVGIPCTGYPYSASVGYSCCGTNVTWTDGGYMGSNAIVDFN